MAHSKEANVSLLIDARLTKRYGARVVLHEATIRVQAGTVHALVGENGAGKSTLVKLLAGVVTDATGELAVSGARVNLGAWNRRSARAAGIGIVQQHGSSAGTLTVIENAMLGVEPRRGPFLALGAPAAALRERGAALGFAIDPDATADSLSLGAAQRAEIVAALHHGAKLLVLDEPTAVLAPVEVDALLATLRKLAQRGTAIIIVTHKLDEVRAVADVVTVLRAGATVATFTPPLEVATIARAMVGEDLPKSSATTVEAPPASSPEQLAIGGLKVLRGELVGVAGVDGNGQRELALAIAGLASPADPRALRIGGVDARTWSTARRLAAGLAYVPEDRLHGGLVLDASVAENLALGRKDVTGRFVVDRDAVRRHAGRRIAELDIRPADADAIVRGLSGGNQQKVVIGRELSRPNLRAVVASQPTRGVDLGAVVRIHDRLRAAARGGAGVLVISADLDELLALCHRVVVMLRGQLVGEVSGPALAAPDARAHLGAMMTGAGA